MHAAEARVAWRAALRSFCRLKTRHRLAGKLLALLGLIAVFAALRPLSHAAATDPRRATFRAPPASLALARRRAQATPPGTLTYAEREYFTLQQLREGWIALHIGGVIYMFVALAIICDEYFVPTLDFMVDRFHISPDVAGATFMAAGGSAPELFTSLIGTFTYSDVGFGTIVGSAVFNVLFVIGVCAMLAKETLQLTWWPLFRDCTYYSASLLVLAYFFGVGTPNEIEQHEAIILFSMYLGYCLLMKCNQRLYGAIQRCSSGREVLMEEGATSEPPTTLSEVNAFLSPFKYRPTIGAVLSDPDQMEQLFATAVYDSWGSTRSIFNSIDTNSNGEIELDELKQLLRKLGHQDISEAIVAQVIERLDKDKNGRVNFNEFESWYLRRRQLVDAQVSTQFTEFAASDAKLDAAGAKELIKKLHTESESAEVERAVKELRTHKKDSQRRQKAAADAKRAVNSSGAMRRIESDEAARKIAQGKAAFADAPSPARRAPPSPPRRAPPSPPRRGGAPAAARLAAPLTNYHARKLPAAAKPHRRPPSPPPKAARPAAPSPPPSPAAAPAAAAGTPLLLPDRSVSFTMHEFQEWYRDSPYYEEKLMQADATLDQRRAISLCPPRGAGVCDACSFYLVLPIMLALRLTVIDMREQTKVRYLPLSFATCVLWIGVFSYFTVWFATTIGDVFGIPPAIMGLTFLAAGTSIPDLLTSVIVAKAGEGDMAVSSSIGSNIFDVLVGLPVPWLAFTVVKGTSVLVTTDSLFLSILILFVMLASVILTVACSGWRMTKCMGAIMFFLYALFVAQDLGRTYGYIQVPAIFSTNA
ncbi:hypothetical protein AB1Y20_006353 [Prymnesium parvum]|uniref:EF-hand domain-containing protein n=1 Tax=Prymnesium parvum TaxID=97485 RepID=A0AB34J4V8_PRYPA